MKTYWITSILYSKPCSSSHLTQNPSNTSSLCPHFLLFSLSLTWLQLNWPPTFLQKHPDTLVSELFLGLEGCSSPNTSTSKRPTFWSEFSQYNHLHWKVNYRMTAKLFWEFSTGFYLHKYKVWTLGVESEQAGKETGDWMRDRTWQILRTGALAGGNG